MTNLPKQEDKGKVIHGFYEGMESYLLYISILSSGSLELGSLVCGEGKVDDIQISIHTRRRRPHTEP